MRREARIKILVLVFVGVLVAVSNTAAAQIVKSPGIAGTQIRRSA